MIKIPSVSIDYKDYKPVAFGQYFQAFPYQDTSDKVVEIKDNEGKTFNFKLKAMKSFQIKSVNGVPRWDASLTYDGTEDMVIELEGTIDPGIKIGVELHNKVSGVRFNSPVFYSNDKNRITIPKEAFRNSLKYIKDNMLIVSKYKETLLDDQAVGNGALRIIDTYHDFTPITIEGELTKSLFIKAFKEENRKDESRDLSEVTKYDFQFKKGDPLYYPPSKEIKKIAIPSFVVRGNLMDQHIDVTVTSDANTITTTTSTLTKWFPQKFEKETWQKFADRLYNDFETALKKKYNVPVVDVKQIIAAKSYQKIIPILDTITKSFVEVGAYGTQRVIPSFKKQRAVIRTTGDESLEEVKQEGEIGDKGGDHPVQINTFPSDFVSSRVMKEFGANCVVTVNFDLEFDIVTENLLPVVSIKFFAPVMNPNGGMNYYHEITAYSKESISLAEAKKHASGNTIDQIYKMIDAPRFFSELLYTLDKISQVEKDNPVYQKMFDAMH